MVSQKTIDDFLKQEVIAVAGVSRNKNKFGNAVYKELKTKGYTVYAVNPNLSEFEGDKCYKSLNELPRRPGGLVVAVNKNNAVNIVNDAFNTGISRIWFQIDSHSEEAVKLCEKNNISVIFGECILMFAQPQGFHKFHRWVNGIFHKLPV